MQTGGIKRRGGTERIGKLKGYARLIPFIVNNTLSFIFEIGSEYIRIWKNGSLLTLAGFPVEFSPTPDLPLYQKVIYLKYNMRKHTIVFIWHIGIISPMSLNGRVEMHLHSVA